MTRWLDRALTFVSIAVTAYALRTLLALKALIAGACPLLLVLLLAGCASQPTRLDTLNRDIQNCILSGGHPHLGPDRIVLCGD